MTPLRSQAFRSQSLALTVAIGLAVVTAAVLGGFTWLSHRSERTRQLAQLQQEQRVLAEQLAVSLSLAVWNFDRPQIARVVKAGMANPDVVAIAVRLSDAERSVIGRRRNGPGASEPVDDLRLLPADRPAFTRPVLVEREPVGELTLSYTPEHVEARLRRELGWRLGRILVLDLVLIASAYALLWWLLLRPLRLLEDDAARIRRGEAVVLADSGGQFRGEMGSLRASLGAMLEQLQGRYDQVVRSETRFRQLVLNAEIGMALFDRDLVPLEISPSLCAILGASREELLSSDPLSFLYPADRPAAQRDLERLVHGGVSAYRRERRLRRRDGEVVWAELCMNVLGDSSGRITHYFLQVQNTTERKRREQENERLSNLFQVLSRINLALVRANTQAEVFDAIARTLVETGRFQTAWIGWGNEATRMIEPVAVVGDELGYVAGLDISTDPDHPASRGPSGTAFREARTYVCNDFFADAATLPWRERAERSGIRASVALPLRRAGQVRGLLTVYAAEQHFFTPQKIELLEEAADNISFALDVLAERDRRREAEAALRRSEGRLQFLLTATPAIIYSLRPGGDFGVTFLSRNVREVLGHEAEEFAADPGFWQAHLHPDDARVIDRSFAGLARQDTLVREYRFRRRDGVYRWMLDETRVVRDPQGRPLELVGYWLDVTARKAAEQQLADLAERLQLALEIGRVGVWQHWPGRQQTLWDANTHALFGVAAGATPHSLDQFFALLHPEDRAAYAAAWDDLVRTGRELRLRFRLVRAGGEVRHVEAHAVLRRDEAGGPGWVLGVNIDLTDVVTASTNAERYRAQLIQAQKMETLGQMAGSITHDFNNLLTGINGFVELAALALPPQHKSLKMLEHAMRAADSARELVRRILVFSRQTSAKQQLPVRLSDVVRDTAPLVSTLFPASIALELDLPAQEPPVMADAGQIQQVLMNLCSNSAHAIGVVRGSVRISVDTVAGEAARVRLRVADTGCGMDEATLRRVFEPFFTTKKAGEGTGLGVPIVLNIVQDHGGTVDIASEVGRGTTFTLQFPACAPAPTLVPARVEAGAGDRGGGRVLVVDDEPTVTTLVTALLQRAGYSVVACASPQEAWRALAADANRFDLVLTDYLMAEMNGSEFIRRARELAPELGGIIMTGNLGEIDALVRGGHQVVAKPFDNAALVEAIRRELERRAARRPTAAPGPP
ncbi:MAG: PAS domain-containing protein [Opitutaceae bacterium]|nr:PAS domain-containing protein [Opitutaceae bacterium]